MDPGVSRGELRALVTEVDRLIQARQERLTDEEVRQVLRDLDMPPELLETALTTVRERELELARRRRRLRVIASAIAVLVAAAAALFVFLSSRAARFDDLRGEIVALGQGPQGPARSRFSRGERPELWFRVALRDAPAGERLELSCDWYSPAGTLVHQTTWETQPVQRSPWLTHCRYRIPENAPRGTWSVRMVRADQGLATARFELDD